MCVICVCVCVWAWIIVWSVESADGLLCLSVRLSDGMMIIIIIVDYTTQRTLYKYYVYALQYFISTSPFNFLYILYFFIFISDSLENIKNHWVQFKAHTQNYTYTQRERNAHHFCFVYHITSIFYVNAKKLSSKWERMTFFWRQKTESGSLRITARPLLNYPRSATHRLPNNYSLCGCGCSRICYTKCTKYRKVNLCLNVFLDFLKIREGGQRTKELSLILSTNA